MPAEHARRHAETCSHIRMLGLLDEWAGRLTVKAQPPPDGVETALQQETYQLTQADTDASTQHVIREDFGLAGEPRLFLGQAADGTWFRTSAPSVLGALQTAASSSTALLQILKASDGRGGRWRAALTANPMANSASTLPCPNSRTQQQLLPPRQQEQQHQEPCQQQEQQHQERRQQQEQQHQGCRRPQPLNTRAHQLTQPPCPHRPLTQLSNMLQGKTPPAGVCPLVRQGAATLATVLAAAGGGSNSTGVGRIVAGAAAHRGQPAATPAGLGSTFSLRPDEQTVP